MGKEGELCRLRGGKRGLGARKQGEGQNESSNLVHVYLRRFFGPRGHYPCGPRRGRTSDKRTLRSFFQRAHQEINPAMTDSEIHLRVSEVMRHVVGPDSAAPGGRRRSIVGRPVVEAVEKESPHHPPTTPNGAPP